VRDVPFRDAKAKPGSSYLRGICNTDLEIVKLCMDSVDTWPEFVGDVESPTLGRGRGGRRDTRLR